MRFQIFNCQGSHCPCGQKGNCALLVPKHTRGATVNCQVYTITTHTLLQVFFIEYIKKNKSCFRFFIYNVKNCWKTIFLCEHTFLDANTGANICSPAAKSYTCLLKYLESKKTREIDDFCPSRVFFCINTWFFWC